MNNFLKSINNLGVTGTIVVTIAVMQILMPMWLDTVTTLLLAGALIGQGKLKKD